MTDIPATERVNPATEGLDRMDTGVLVAAIVDDQRAALDAVLAQRDAIAAVVDEIANRIKRGGTLHYVGAGTSGRLGALDAAEMPPTFGTPPKLVRAHIAGGFDALVRAVEGAEDDAGAGAEAVRDVGDNDAVIGVSASGGAAFVVAAVERARAAGAYTVALTSARESRLVRAAQATIVLETGAEALAGSTRLKAGTAQKIALNAISTAVMVRLGKVHGNLMVDVVATNRKLRDRARRLVQQLALVDDARADELLDAAEGGVKVAIVMQRHNVGAAQARALLERHDGSLHELL